MDLISVIVPVYKVEPYLDRCVRSIVEQTYENLEIILVDDGSPDNCGARCDAWAAKDSRVRVIHKKNGGLSDARNAGLAVASGEYISFIDSDDCIAPEFVAELHAALGRTGADIAECATAFVDEGGNLLCQRSTAAGTQMEKMEGLRRLVLEDGIYQTVWNKLYRRAVIDGIFFENGKYHEDDFWTYQVFDRMEKLALVARPMYYYLQRSGSIIGAGYTPKRLDGLEARFLRMQYLQKYDELAALTRQSLVMDCMWHYQSAKTYLQGDEQVLSLKKVRETMKTCPPVPLHQLTGKITHRIWYLLFRAMPELTSWIRSKLGIEA